MKLSLFLVVTFCLALQTIHAQSGADKYQYFDAKWRPVKEKKAVYLLRIRNIGDSCWQYNYYNMLGPMIRVETYQDEKASIRHGLFAWYDHYGKLDSSGYYYRGIPNGDWYHPHDSGKTSTYYDMGRLLTKGEYEKKLESMQVDDPSFPDLSRSSPESHFPGGTNGWFRFLHDNLRYPQHAIDNLVSGTVQLLFMVQPSGKIADPRIRQSVEISLDDEALRLLSESPDWVPAIKFDKKVRSFKIQPIVFRFASR